MRIEFNKNFTKRFDNLPRKIQGQFYSRLEMFEQDQFHPLLNNHSIHHPYEGCRSINISGDIRALYENSNDTIKFIRIGTHSELYK